jgi:mycothiol synthase
MPGKDELVIRSFEADDRESLRAIMLDAFDEGEFDGLERADVEYWWERLDIDPLGTLVARELGEVCGLITPRWNQLTVARLHRRKGIGTALVSAGEILCRRRGEDPLSITLPRDNPGSEAFLSAIGYAYHYSLWLMKLPASIAISSEPLSPRFASRSYRLNDLERYVELVNHAFQDHPMPYSITVEGVDRAQCNPSFDPSDIILVSLADSPDQLIGFCKIALEPDSGTPRPEIDLIGVLPDHRGHGVGRWLLTTGIQLARERGAQEVFLKVDSRNEQAVGLYDTVGFVITEEWPRWCRGGA